MRWWRWAVGCLLACGGTAVPAPNEVADAGPVTDSAVTSPDASYVDAAAFTLSSPAFVDGGTLPRAFTCDGVGTSPPLSWTTPPRGTTELALLMTTEAKDGTKWNWVLYTIPSSASSLAEGSVGVGVAGLTSDGPALAYAPPCSQGPGAKVYTFALYALSGHPALPADPRAVTGAALAASMESLVLARSTLAVSYSR